MQTTLKPQIQAKATVVDQATEKYGKSAGVLFTEYRGLKTGELQALRKQLRAKGGELQVIKNTLFRKALGEDSQKLTEDLTSGPTAIAFIYENEADCAKVVMDFAKSSKRLVVKGGLIGGKVYDANGVDALSKLPPREVLIAQVLGAIAAPLSNLVGVIEALYADPIRVIGAVADKVGEGAGPVENSAAEAKAPEAEAEIAAEIKDTTESSETAQTEQPAAEAATTTEATPAQENNQE